MNFSQKNAPTASEQAAEIQAWKNRPKTESEYCRARQEEYLRMLQARKDGTAPLYLDTRTGKEYR